MVSINSKWFYRSRGAPKIIFARLLYANSWHFCQNSTRNFEVFLINSFKTPLLFSTMRFSLKSTLRKHNNGIYNAIITIHIVGSDKMSRIMSKKLKNNKSNKNIERRLANQIWLLLLVVVVMADSIMPWVVKHYEGNQYFWRLIIKVFLIEKVLWLELPLFFAYFSI